MQCLFSLSLFLLKLKIQGQGEVAIIFCVHNCEHSFLIERTCPPTLLLFFSFFRALIAGTLQSFILAIKENVGGQVTMICLCLDRAGKI